MAQVCMKSLLLFIHGLGGCPQKTWGKFSQLIYEDNDLSDKFDCVFFKYKTSVWPWPLKYIARGQVLADALDTKIVYELNQYKDIVIIAHSLGGLISKRYILDRIKFQDNMIVRKVVFFATPHLGSSLAGVVRKISIFNQHLKQLCRDSEFIGMINREWNALDTGQVEKLNIIGSEDIIVSQQEGTNIYSGKYCTVEGKDHCSIVKPTSADDLSFKIVKSFLLQTQAHQDRVLGAFKNKSLGFLKKNIENHKYIKNIYVESNDLKELARWFTDPLLFFEKYYNSRASFESVRSYLEILGFSGFNQLSTNVSENLTLTSISDLCESDVVKINKNILLLSRVGKVNYEAIESNSNLSEEQKYYAKHRRSDFYPEYIIDDLNYEIDELKLFTKNIFILLAPAGHGKTNFICDFAESVFFKKGIPCILCSGVDFNGAESILDQINGSILKGTLSIQEFSEIFFKSDNKYTYIVIDGLNENSKTLEFSELVFKLISSTYKTKIKCILTCRTDCFDNYYKKRLSVLDENIFMYRNIVTRYSYKEKLKLFHGYLKHFNIEVENYTDDVFESLTENPLLLRFFCESYKGSSSKITSFPNIDHLYKAEIFNCYYRNKLRDMDLVCSPAGFARMQANDVVLKIARYMVDKETFNDIPICELLFSEKELEILHLILDEDIILKSDNKLSSKDLLSLPIEVINFTFDEFRDFIISVYVYTRMRESGFEYFKKYLQHINDTSLPITEGVFRYLFYHIKKQGDVGSIDFLCTLTYYKRILLQEYYIIEDEYLGKKDLDILQQYFVKNYFAADFIYRSFSRSNCDIYKNFNLSFVINNLICLPEKTLCKILRDNIDKNERFNYRETYIKPSMYISKIRHVVDRLDGNCDNDIVKICYILYIVSPYHFKDLFGIVCEILQRNILLLSDVLGLSGFVRTMKVSQAHKNYFIAKLFDFPVLERQIDKYLDTVSHAIGSVPDRDIICFEYQYEHIRRQIEGGYEYIF